MLPLVSKRYTCVLVFLGLGFVVLASRLVYLAEYREKFKDFITLSRQRIRTLPAARGQIVDCKGRCLATQQKVYEVGVDLTQIKEDKTHLPALAQLLQLPLKRLELLWHPSEKRWQLLRKNVSESIYEKVKELGIRGVYGNSQEKRFYLHTPSLSYVVGFLNNEGTAVCGIEKIMNFYLKGQNGYRAYEVNGKNLEMAHYRTESIDPIHGYTVELTIDHQIQSIVEQVLRKAFDKYHPLSLQAIVTKPYTGEILALVNVPFFDSNHYNKVPVALLTPRAISDIYEPGSVFKAITVSAALDCGAVSLEDRFDCRLTQANYQGKMLPLPNDWKTFNQVMTVPEVLSHSSNRGTVQIAFRLGAKRLYDYARNFGFGASTKSGFPGETKGMLHPLERWDGLTITRLPIGHGIACSLLQMHYAMSAIANGGLLFYPQMVHRIYNIQGDIIHTFKPEVHRRVLKPETCRDMRRIMRLPEQSRAFIPQYNVTGKTGTTQKIVNGQYSHSQHIASFSGFFPNNNPQIHITLTVDSPKLQGTGYGSVVAAPLFKEMAESIITYIGLEPESKLL